ncbi:MAG: YigZ family protein [Paludibacteraceae bacterium]|nr:YigZ family protein [Paludibacteraceae bacterium]
MEQQADTYKTIAEAGEGLYKEKGSRFIAFAFPVCTTDEVKNLVEAKRKEYHDARHVCYVYRINPEKIEFRANDDGEPSGTAGRPMLGVLQSKELVNICIICVRYFGGIKLGTSGLANAYKVATEDALLHCETIERTIDAVFRIHFDYLYLNDVMRITKDMKPDVLSQEFNLACDMILRIRKQQADALKERLGKVQTLKFIE